MRHLRRDDGVQLTVGMLSELIHAWHDFYVLVGTASATLVGLMFVTATIGAQVFTEKNRAGMRAFLSPTVAHFSAVLFISIVAAIPSQTWQTLAVVLGASGLCGIAYSARVWVQLFVRRRFDVDVIDRVFYALLPVLGYLLILMCVYLLLKQSALGLDLLAAALITLLLAGIRNAWDMTIWIVIRTPVAESGRQKTEDG
jgi:hypothetical protein